MDPEGSGLRRLKEPCCNGMVCASQASASLEKWVANGENGREAGNYGVQLG